MDKPRIRFKGYTDAWEQRKLGELGEIMTGSTPSTSKTEYYSEDGIPWVTPTDINAQTISDTPRKLSEEGAKVGRVVPANTILCTCIASIGKNTLLTVKGSFNQQINSLTPNDENDAYFLLTESEIWSDKMKRMAASGTMQIVNKTEFSELLTMIPELTEQKKIGEYFKNLDHLITLHQRKCEQVKKLKKYMLQKMFPQNGSNFPEIRFDGFTNAWEQRKWIDTVDISTEMVNPSSGEYDDMPHIAPGNIESFTGRILDNVKTVKEEQLISGKFRFRPGDVVYGKINPQLGKYFFASVDGLTSADSYVLNSKNGLTQKFLFALLQTNDFFKYSVSVSKRSGMPKINRDELNAYSFLMPTETEQVKIGEFLLRLDHLITLHQRKYEEQQNVRKFMLQSMFM